MWRIEVLVLVLAAPLLLVVIVRPMFPVSSFASAVDVLSWLKNDIIKTASAKITQILYVCCAVSFLLRPLLYPCCYSSFVGCRSSFVRCHSSFVGCRSSFARPRIQQRLLKPTGVFVDENRQCVQCSPFLKHQQKTIPQRKENLKKKKWLMKSKDKKKIT